MSDPRPGEVLMGVPMPPPARKRVDVYRPAVGKASRVLCVNHRPVGLYVHWDGQRTRHHLEPKELCESCKRGHRMYWTSYLGGWHLQRGRHGIWEVTRNAVESLPVLRGDSQESLRGRYLTFWRAGSAKNSPIVASMEEMTCSPLVCPPEFSVAEALETLWELPWGTLRYPKDSAPRGSIVADAQDEDLEVRGL